MECYFIGKKLTDEEAIKNINNRIKKEKLSYEFKGFVEGKYKGACYTHLLLFCEKHGEWNTTSYNDFINGGRKCPKCGFNKIAAERRKSIDTIISEINNHIKDNNLNYKFLGFVGGKYVNQNTKLILECDIHGIWKTTGYDKFIRGSRCPNCKSSKMEDVVYNFLMKYNIDFEKKKKFDDCFDKNKLQFDYYINDFNICIECDGIQHFKPIEFFGGIKAFNSQKRRDDIKTNWCKMHGVDLIRFNYKQSKDEIENKLYTLLVAKAEKIS